MKTSTAAIRFLAILGLFAPAACTGIPAKNAGAPTTLEQAVQANTPSVGKARIHFVLGRNKALLMDMAEDLPADFIVNGATVGGVNKGQVLVIEFDPGIYDFSWRRRYNGADDVKMTYTHKVLHPGDMIYLRADIDHGYGSSFGAIGMMIDPPRSEAIECPSDCPSLIKNLAVVVPTP
jgi:hypothetical protein